MVQFAENIWRFIALIKTCRQRYYKNHNQWPLYLHKLQFFICFEGLKCHIYKLHQSSEMLQFQQYYDLVVPYSRSLPTATRRTKILIGYVPFFTYLTRLFLLPFTIWSYQTRRFWSYIKLVTYIGCHKWPLLATELLEWLWETWRESLIVCRWDDRHISTHSSKSASHVSKTHSESSSKYFNW